MYVYTTQASGLESEIQCKGRRSTSSRYIFTSHGAMGSTSFLIKIIQIIE